jgi:hypothetical protein
MFDGFELSMIDSGEAVIRVRHGGSGPPLLLLRGHPQTHLMWHKVAPRLAQDFTVVAADLRGYGSSAKPPTTPDHAPYSKRAMARDVHRGNQPSGGRAIAKHQAPSCVFRVPSSPGLLVQPAQRRSLTTSVSLRDAEFRAGRSQDRRSQRP